MPKRKRNYDSDYDYLAKKVKKLKSKMKRARRRRESSSSSGSDKQSPHNSPERKSIATADPIYEENDVYSPGHSSWYDFSESVKDGPREAEMQVIVADVHPPPHSVANRDEIISAAEAGPSKMPSRQHPHDIIVTDVHPPPRSVANLDEIISAAEAGPLGVPSRQHPHDTNAGAVPNTVDPITQSNESEQVVELDSDLMEILGEDPTCTKEYGSEIQKDLAIRLNHIATSGISKENRKDIKEKYLVPSNCKLLKAPLLNSEIRASLVEAQAKRDKGIENKQTMNSCALSSLSAAITMLLASENKNPELLKLLMDTARILADIQYSESILRRHFILSTVKKDLRDQLEKTKIDEMLFGSNLAETIKSAKVIIRSGADIRSAPAPKPMAQTAPKPPGRPLNYRPPPAYRRGAAAGAARGARPPPPPTAPIPRATTTRPTQHSAYRMSSRQPPARHRRY